MISDTTRVTDQKLLIQTTPDVFSFNFLLAFPNWVGEVCLLGSYDGLLAVKGMFCLSFGVVLDLKICALIDLNMNVLKMSINGLGLLCLVILDMNVVFII